MWRVPSNRSAAVRMLLVFAAIGIQSGFAECPVPGYRQGHVWEKTPSTIMMNISLDIGDFAPKRLICLAGALRQRYSDRKSLLIMMFSSHAAARNYTMPYIPCNVGRCPNWSVDMHGVFSFNINGVAEAVVISPFGGLRNFGIFNTRIDVPVASVPHCTLEISSRCLLAASGIEYPWNMLEMRIEVDGDVTLEGDIAKDGRVTKVRIAADEIPRNEPWSMLAKAARNSLEAWRFEPAERIDPIRLTYSYTVDKSAGIDDRLVRFELPDRVLIRGRPLR